MKWVLLIFSPILLLGAGIIGLYFMIPEFIREVVKFLTKGIITVVIVHQFYRIISWYFDIPNLDLTQVGDFCNNHPFVTGTIIVLSIFIGFITISVKNDQSMRIDLLEKRLGQYPTAKK